MYATNSLTWPTLAIILAAQVSALTIPLPLSLSPYAPVGALCPIGEPLVRPAVGLNANEAAFIKARKSKADAALRKWLEKTNSEFGCEEGVSMPTIGLTTSGGGYRSLLVGAGVIQGFDERDSNGVTSGLFQAITYQAGLSGGSWLLSSFAGNNYPTISQLKKNLWEQAFQDSLLDPAFLLAAPAYAKVIDDLAAKNAQGFPPTLTDAWGRLLSYQLVEGVDGGAAVTLSSVAGLSNFTSHNVPYPLITSLGVKTFNNECSPGPNATTYEFSPFEFGSWDSDVSAFTPTKYLGSSLSNGKPVIPGVCVEKYDNLGYVLGSSSSLFNEVCSIIPAENTTAPSALFEDLAGLLAQVKTQALSDNYANYPNPFYKYLSPSAKFNSANNIQGQKELNLVDGGEALQNNPIFPMLQPARGINVLLVNDNSADTSNNFPNGSEILTTYVQTFNHDLTRMPVIPSVDTFIAEGLNKRATFFGCNDTSKITIVYIPNVNITFQSNVPTAQLEYPKNETDAMIANGVAMVETGGVGAGPEWGTCLGCAIMKKTKAKLPKECVSCFTKYCYRG